MKADAKSETRWGWCNEWWWITEKINTSYQSFKQDEWLGIRYSVVGPAISWYCWVSITYFHLHYNRICGLYSDNKYHINHPQTYFLLPYLPLCGLLKLAFVVRIKELFIWNANCIFSISIQQKIEASCKRMMYFSYLPK